MILVLHKTAVVVVVPKQLPVGSTPLHLLDTRQNRHSSHKAAMKLVQTVMKSKMNNNNSTQNVNNNGALNTKLTIEADEEESTTVIMSRLGQMSSSELLHMKESLVESLSQKLSLVQGERDSLQQEIALNDELGQNLINVIESKIDQSVSDRLQRLTQDLERVTILKLNLRENLDKTQATLLNLSKNDSSTIDGTEKNCDYLGKKEQRLLEQLDEARKLEECINERLQKLICNRLEQCLMKTELEELKHFIGEKSRLRVEEKQIELTIRLGQKHIEALKACNQSINHLIE